MIDVHTHSHYFLFFKVHWSKMKSGRVPNNLQLDSLQPLLDPFKLLDPNCNSDDQKCDEQTSDSQPDNHEITKKQIVVSQDIINIKSKLIFTQRQQGDSSFQSHYNKMLLHLLHSSIKALHSQMSLGTVAMSLNHSIIRRLK